MLGRAVFSEGGAVMRGRVTGILRPAVSGEGVVKAVHQLIAVGFGEDGCRCNCEELTIAAHYAGVRN